MTLSAKNGWRCYITACKEKYHLFQEPCRDKVNSSSLFQIDASEFIVQCTLPQEIMKMFHGWFSKDTGCSSESKVNLPINSFVKASRKSPICWNWDIKENSESFARIPLVSFTLFHNPLAGLAWRLPHSLTWLKVLTKKRLSIILYTWMNYLYCWP